jgi:hypothetical protein
VQDKLAVHDFIAQVEHKNKKLILRTGSRVLIFHFRFKTSEKSLYEAVEIVINFCHKAYKGGGAYVQYFLDIVLERDVRNQAGIADF